ncbi:MAG: hypothetical protein KC482_12245 [Dehalococcoidia bacterium]|nr:hypothetical protein [Dehalococcoidia bacterium]MCA9845006.1 hypothetical protein [Dehalococcoidia bacterium]MCA9854342.1 hypothetical protein [Dehalococcoidia bacterium]
MTILYEKARRAFRRHDESGQGLAEYALILGFVAAICVGSLTAFGNVIANSPGFSLI